VIWGLAAYGATKLYEKYSGSVDQATSAGRAVADRVSRTADRVRGHAQEAANEVATHARAASQEIRETASDVVDLAQPAVPDGEEAQSPQD
jgi:hypothetical protein